MAKSKAKVVKGDLIADLADIETRIRAEVEDFNDDIVQARLNQVARAIEGLKDAVWQSTHLAGRDV